MIEPTAIVYVPEYIDTTAYIGHHAIVGHPRRVRPQLDACDDAINHWEPSAGAQVMRRAVVSARCHVDDGVVIEPGAWIGSGCRIGHDTRILEMAELYYSCQVYDRVIIGRGAVVGGFVCNDARVGARAQVYGSLVHRLVDAPPTGADPRPAEFEPAPIVEEDSVVGINAVVVGGVTVGRGAYIAAGAVLTRDAEPGTLYKGVPARAIGPAPKPIASS